MDSVIFSTEEVAVQNGVTRIAVQKWAQSNNVSYTGEGNRKTYQFTEADVERFRQRPHAGRPRKDN